jgi:hypothetical protein
MNTQSYSHLPSLFHWQSSRSVASITSGKHYQALLQVTLAAAAAAAAVFDMCT